MKNELYRYIAVWERLDRQLVRFNCFELLSKQEFVVQSADFFSGTGGPKQDETHFENFLELLIEDAPANRTTSFKTLEEAILQHKHDFSFFTQ